MTLTPEAALEHAKSAAKEFGVGESRTVDFEKERAKADLKEGDKKAKKNKSKTKGVEEAPEEEAN